MDPTSKGAWLIPTKDRVHTHLPRFLAACKATGVSTPGMILVEEAEYAAQSEAYDALDLPEGWIVQPVRATCTREAVDAADRIYSPGLQWLGYLQDDLVPETPGWDVRCIQQLTGWNVVSTNDGAHAPKRMNGATVWSADLIHAAGGLYPPGCKHYFLDDSWEELGKMTGCWQVDMSIMVRHHNALWTGDRDTTSTRTNAWFDEDRRAYIEWQKTDAVPAAERIIALMADYGMRVQSWDFRGVKLCIATPCGSGSYDAGFIRALDQTKAFVRQFGGQVQFIEFVGCSDLPLARNSLFATFLMTEDTHLLWIDDDMRWKPQDVGQLLMAKKDFTAIAGPRKVDKLSCAVSVDNDHGTPLPIKVDRETGFLEVSGIGMAFTLLTRQACVKMRQHYTDLEYVNAGGHVECGVFMPMILNRAWKSEDFSFCYRWRQIGGKILIAAELGIGHVGTKEYTGSWGDELRMKIAEQGLAA